ncbi:MAG: hypothetical protein K2X87_19205 [Gemmataceae bacterium]|nr:hypothetical protein [Gemmataceae bacterium]
MALKIYREGTTKGSFEITPALTSNRFTCTWQVGNWFAEGGPEKDAQDVPFEPGSTVKFQWIVSTTKNGMPVMETVDVITTVENKKK